MLYFIYAIYYDTGPLLVKAQSQQCTVNSENITGPKTMETTSQ